MLKGTDHHHPPIRSAERLMKIDEVRATPCRSCRFNSRRCFWQLRQLRPGAVAFQLHLFNIHQLSRTTRRRHNASFLHEHHGKTSSLCVCRLPLHDMASSTAPGDSESRLYELLEKILQAVTRLNENVESLSKATTRMGSCNTTQVSRPDLNSTRSITELTAAGGAATGRTTRQDIGRDSKLCHDK